MATLEIPPMFMCFVTAAKLCISHKLLETMEGDSKRLLIE